MTAGRFNDADGQALGFAWENCSRALIGRAKRMSHRLTHARQLVRTRKEEILETSIFFSGTLRSVFFGIVCIAFFLTLLSYERLQAYFETKEAIRKCLKYMLNFRYKIFAIPTS